MVRFAFAYEQGWLRRGELAFPQASDPKGSVAEDLASFPRSRQDPCVGANANLAFGDEGRGRRERGRALPPSDHSDWKSKIIFVLIASATLAATFFASGMGTEHSLLKVFSKKSCMDWWTSGSW